ncbi:voltage-gated purine nucleotide uniporter SLC17A9 isoform X2 [Danio rerio]|uniref:Voltage-gated purine nucleotide uniporter SLC17A9 n=2 Tax=Danio rerio TaxID=7955 RepID=E9QCB4_DANRE|nr:solute carrier family 17 member 9 [Danio rerio]|eukprot:XP_001336574.1 solute carrier family 17 member 9 [Danio rerio]
MADEQETGLFNPHEDVPFIKQCDCSTPGLQITQSSSKPTVWPRPLARTWTLMLLLVTCVLHWSRMAMPICAVTMAREFEWSKTETGMVLGAFFWGYCFTQVVGGHASDRIGGERVLLLSTSSWGIMTALTPILAKTGLSPLLTMTASRFLLGVMQGVHYPSLVSICSQRVTEGERGLLMSTLACGCYLGMMLVGGVGSLMLDWFGWQSVFYGAGLLAVFWACCVWKCLLQGTDISLDSLWISRKDVSESSRINWLYLLREPSVWAMIIAHLCFSSSYYTLMSWLPTFFKDTFPHAKDWVFNVIPWFVALPTSLFGGSISDHLIRQGCGTAAVRKLMQFCSMGVASVFILFLCKTSSFIQAVACVSVTIGLSTFHNSGVSVNVNDQAPSCAGALYGVMNTCAAFTGLLMVYISGYMIEVTGSWVNVFSVLALVNVIGVAVFITLGEAKRIDQLDEPEII